MEADSEETVQNIANFLKATAKVPEEKQEAIKSENGQSKLKKIESSKYFIVGIISTWSY